MTTIELGQTYTTHKSNVTGIVMEIVPNPTGTFRVRLELEDGETRWTTYVPKESE